jgi:hypothetical protein
MSAGELRTRSPRRLLKIEESDFAPAPRLGAARAAITATILVKNGGRCSGLSSPLLFG